MKRKSKKTPIPVGSQVDPAMAKPSKRQQKAIAVVPTKETSLIDVIARAASDPQVDVAKMEKLLEMHTKIVAKNSEDAFNIAMNAAQSEISRIATDADNSQTQSKYATYAKLDRVLRPVYIRHGFSLSFTTNPSAPAEYVHTICYVSHNAGYTREYNAVIPYSKTGPKGNAVMTDTHAAGSAMQYGMRYLLKYIFNVAIGAEDDGNAAGAGPKLNAEQVAEINQLIKKTDSGSGTYVSSYLGYISKLAKCTINIVEEIPASVFKDAKAVLVSKLPKDTTNA